MMKLLMKGIIPPVVTPLLNNNTIDAEGLERLIEHLLAGGVHGLFILGTTGEATSLSYTLRKEMIKRTIELVKKHVPIVVGVTDTSLNGTMKIADYAAEMGADGVVISAPFYLPISQDEMREYLENIVPGLPLPFMMYDMPGCTKLHMSVETIRKAKELGAIGIKDSSGDMAYLYSIIQEFKDSPDFSVITGTEIFLPDTILNGGHGAVAGGANLFPELFVDLYNASLERDYEKIAILREKLILIDNTIYNVGKHKSRIIKGIKCSLSVMDICSDYVALPLHKYKEDDKRKIEQHIKNISQVIYNHSL